MGKQKETATAEKSDLVISPEGTVIEEQSTGLRKVDQASIMPVQDEESGPMKMLATAIEKGADMAQIEQLMDLAERHDRNQAKRAFTLAMANFKANAPALTKDSKASFDHKEGNGKTEYKWASLAQIASKVAEVMGQFGLSHHWDIDQDSQQGQIIVTCTITHALGHSESVKMRSQPETSGKKNAIQQTASAITYMQRYTLLAACGLAAADASDDDGRATGSPETSQQEEEFYPDDKFEKNFPNWVDLIEDGKKTKSELISFLSTRSKLSPDQIEKINSI